MILDDLIDDIAAEIAAPTEDLDAESLNRTGLDRLSVGDRWGARAAFEAAVRIDPSLATAWNNLGRSLHAERRLDEAVAAFGAAIEVRPDHPEAMSNRGLAWQDLGKSDAALADFDRALSLCQGPFAAIVLHNRGALRHESGDLAGALADFDRAIEIDPDLIATRLNRGTVRKAMGDLDNALEDAEHAMAHLPRDRSAEAFHLRGGIRALRDDFRSALADYNEALAIAPRNAYYAISRGNTRYHLRDRNAIDDFRLAFRIDPTTAAREIVRAAVEDARRRPDDILENCAKHLRINDSDSVAYMRRGLTLVALGRIDEARPDFETCRSLMGPIWEMARLVIDEAYQRETGVI